MAITVKHTKVSTVPDSADTSLVRPSDWNADHTLTGLGTMAEQDANNVNITGGSISGATVSGYIPTTEKGANNGVATLDAGGKVPTSQIPLQGDLNYQGTWNANTNTPTLTSSTGTKGYYYVVDVAGTTNLNGITDWQIGDWAIFNGTVWQKVDNTDAVTSVNGQVGAVVLTTTNIAEGTNEYFTQAKARNSLSAGTGITYSTSTGVITNAAPDQTVGLTAGTGISVSGTYPNFTITNTSPSSGGDVVGPASATDNAITRFDLTTGKLIQNSTVTLDDNGNIINANSLGLDTTPATVPTAVGTVSWDDGDGVPTVQLKGGNVNLQVGTQEYARVYNDSGTTLTRGQVVYISGSQGNRVAVKLARADVEATSFGTIGLVAETINNGAEGFIVVSGALYKLNTTGLTAGATVYVSPTTAGALTTTKPQAPDQLVVVGWVERVDNIVGSIYVKVDNGYELDELHDVRITSPQSGNVLIYDASTSPIGVWKNANLTDGTGISITEGAGSVTVTNTGVTALSAGTGISVSGSTGSVTVTNTAPDQVVSLTAGTGISTSGTYPSFTVTNTAPDQTVVLTAGTGISTSGTYPNFTITNSAPDQTVSLTGAGTTTISGTYPNFTITSNDQYTGTVTSVSGSAPIASSGGNTPTISITQATSSTDGYLSSTDWNTFNNKQPAGTYVTSVGATSPVTSTGGTTPTIAMPAANGSTNGYLTSTDWTTFNSKGNGTVTSVGGTGTVNGITLTGTVTSSGNLTLGGTLSGVNLTTQVTGTLPIANGGTGQTTANAAYNALSPMTTTGDMTYEAAGGIATRLPIGTSGQVLTVSGGIPAWGAAASSNITANGLWENAATISSNYTIGTNNNAMSAGPITVATGVTVTVPTGSTWTVV
jgi:hypothetical protein